MRLALLLLAMAPLLAGWRLAELLLGRRGLAAAGIGACVGLGVSSITYFLMLRGGASAGFIVAADAALYCAAAGLLLLARRPGPGETGGDAPLRLKQIFWVLAFLAALLFMAQHLYSPHGAWDAWANWNSKARFLFYGGEAWGELFSGAWGYTVGRRLDYPLLITCSVARLWTYWGSASTFIPGLVGLIFSLSIVCLFIPALRSVKGAAAAYAGAAVMLAPAYFSVRAASQYSDTPLAFFFLCAITLAYLLKDSPNPGRVSLLLGICVGLAAWTKNEGRVFSAVFLLVAAAAPFLSKDAPRISWPRFLAGFLPLIAFVVYFKVFIVPPSEYEYNANTMERLLNASRWLEYAGRISWRFLISNEGITAALLVFLGLAGKNIPAGFEGYDRWAFTIFVITFAGYSAAYVVGPYTIKENLDNSNYRIFLQWWPYLLFWAFARIRLPETPFLTARKP